MIYLQLLHGRSDPKRGAEQETVGPMFKRPYAVLGLDSGCQSVSMGDGNSLTAEGGFIYYDGLYYEGLSICDMDNGHVITPFNQKLTQPARTVS